VNLVGLAKLNELRFPKDPRPITQLQRWCRNGQLPAKKIGGEWYVDLDEFDKRPLAPDRQTISPQALAVLEKLKYRARQSERD
jgi:hypothetical protein